jgi:cell division protein YceG involved in septum cleavage
MNKLVLALILMVYAAFSVAFAINFNGDVSASESSQFIVDVGSGASTMYTVAEKPMLIKNTKVLNTQMQKSDGLSIGVKSAEGTGGYIAKMSLLKHSPG